MSDKIDILIETISNMTVKEISEAVKKMEEVFGVSAAAPVMMAGAGAAVAEAGPEAEEKTSFNVILKDFGAKKVEVIRQVRALTQLDLREAKALVEACGKAVLEDASKEDAEKAKKMLEDAGATVEIS